MVAKLYRVTKPVPMWQVVYRDPFKRDAKGRARRVRKHFVDLADAEAHQKEINERVAIEGTAGLTFDANVRADAIAARQWLDVHGHRLLTLRQLAERYTSQVTATSAAARPIGPEVKLFLEEMELVEEAPRETVKNLRTRLWLWIDLAKISCVGDISRHSVECLRTRDVSSQTRRNDMNAVSTFCTWLVSASPPKLDHHPLKGVKRPRVKHGKKPTWSNDECQRVLAAGAALGRQATAAVLIFAGPRPSELGETKLIYGRHPLVRIEGGKLKGRANRAVPMQPALRAFLAANGNPARVPPLTRLERERMRDAAGVTWQPDVHRHTYISNRLQLVRNDAQVAREGGTSETVIYRHYHGLKTPAEARAWAKLRPAKPLTLLPAPAKVAA